MFRISRDRRFARMVVAVAGASVLVAACGAGDNGVGTTGDGEGEGVTTGSTEDSVRIGTHMPLTGPVAPGYSEIPQGHQAYYNFVNAEGGIHGRQIDYVVRDDVYNPSQTTQVVNQLVLQDEVFAIVSGLGTPTHSAVLDFLNEEEVPDLFVSSGALAWNDPETYPWTFGWQPDYEIEGKIAGQYIAENFPDARVGLFLQQDDLGRDGAAGLRQYIDEQIVAEVSYVPTNLDVSTQIAQLQQAGADFVVGFNVPAFTALSQLAARRLNYNPEWYYTNVGSDPQLVGGLLNRLSEGAVADATDALEGIYTSTYLPDPDNPEDPWVQTFSRIWDEHGEGGELSTFRLYGMAQAFTFVSALQSAGEDLTREGIVQAVMDEGESWEGPWFAPLRYAEDSHRGINGMTIARIEGGQIVDQTPVLVTRGGDDPIEESTDDRFEPTESGLPSHVGS
jgi:branched-chain amino acid transport system substrate-binding protein